MPKKYHTEATKKWMLPEHALSVKKNISQNYPKVTLTNSQKDIIDTITKEHKERGYAKGKELGLQAMLNQKKAFMALITEFSSYEKKCDQVLDNEMINVITQICEGILSDTLSEKYQLRNIVQDALESFKSQQQKFVIKVNTKTAEVLGDIEFPDIRQKMQIDHDLEDYSFSIENTEQVVCFSIADSISAYIKK